MNRRVFLWIKIGVACAVLAMMFYTVRPRPIWEALLAARYELLIFAALLMPLNIWTQERKWSYLVKLVKPDATVAETTGSLLGGFAFGIVTPGRIGEYSRALMIKQTDPLNLVGLTVIDKFYNLGCTAAFGLPALFTLPWALKLATGYLLTSMIALLLAINLLLLYCALDPRPVRSLIYAAQMLLPKGQRIAQIMGGLDRFGMPESRVTLFWTVAHYLVFLLQYHLLINAFGKLGFITASRGAAAILFAKSALPIAVGDLGIDQLVSVQFFGQFGVSSETAFNASLLLFGINVLIPALAGVLFVGRIQFDRKNPAETPK